MLVKQTPPFFPDYLREYVYFLHYLRPPERHLDKPRVEYWDKDLLHSLNQD